MTAMVVTLTWAEVLVAHSVAAQRIVYNAKRNSVHRFGALPGVEAEVRDILGARGEMGAAKALNLYWPATVGRDRTDVGGILSVRATARENGSLLMHPDDEDDLLFVLAIVGLPTVRLAGWLWGREGKQQEFWADKGGSGRPAFFVPQAFPPLRDMQELLPVIDRLRTERILKEVEF